MLLLHYMGDASVCVCSLSVLSRACVCLVGCCAPCCRCIYIPARHGAGCSLLVGGAVLPIAGWAALRCAQLLQVHALRSPPGSTAQAARSAHTLLLVPLRVLACGRAYAPFVSGRAALSTARCVFSFVHTLCSVTKLRMRHVFKHAAAKEAAGSIPCQHSASCKQRHGRRTPDRAALWAACTQQQAHGPTPAAVTHSKQAGCALESAQEEASVKAAKPRTHLPGSRACWRQHKHTLEQLAAPSSRWSVGPLSVHRSLF